MLLCCASHHRDASLTCRSSVRSRGAALLQGVATALGVVRGSARQRDPVSRVGHPGACAMWAWVQDGSCGAFRASDLRPGVARLLSLPRVGPGSLQLIREMAQRDPWSEQPRQCPPSIVQLARRPGRKATGVLAKVTDCRTCLSASFSGTEPRQGRLQTDL